MVLGKTTEPLARASLFTSMAMSTKACGSTTRQTVMEPTFMSMELVMREIGRMICSKEGVRKIGLMEVFTSGSIWLARNMAEESTAGTMAVNTMGTGLKIR